MLDVKRRLHEPEVLALLALSVYPAPGRLERAVEAYRTGPGRVLLGLEEGGVLVGCIGLKLISGAVLNIGVAKAAQGRGFGRALLSGAAHHLGLAQLEAETDRDAAGFYHRCGFQVTSLGEPYPGVERFRCVRRG